jgi:tape measure domain-containing protein
MALTDAKTLEIILKLTDQLTGDLKKAKEQITSMEGQLKSTSNAGDRLSSSLKKVASVAGIAFLAKQVYDVGKSIIETTGNFEQWNIAFAVMLGSSGKAKTLMDDIKKFAAATPFELPQVVEGSKRLLAYNVAASDIIPTFTTLGNIAAGVGTEKLPQLITAFGQVSAKGRLMGQELLQFTEAGVNLGGELQKAFGVSRSALETMVSSGKVGFEDVRKALFNLGGETGKFGGLMDAQAKTIQGVWSNIKDTITQAFLAIGNAALPQIRTVVTAMLGKLSEVKIWLENNQAVLASAFTSMFDAIGKVIGVLGRVGSFLYTYLIEPIKEFLKQPVGQWIAGFIAGVYALTVAFTALAAVNPLGWIAIGVAAGIIAFNYLKAHWSDVVSFFNSTINEIKVWFIEFSKHLADIAGKFAAVFVSAGTLAYQALTGQFGNIKDSFAQLQKDIGSASFSFMVTTTKENKTVSTTEAKNTETGDIGLTEFEASLARKREIQIAADADSALRLADSQAAELEKKREHTTTLLADIDAANVVDIEKETLRLTALEKLRNTDSVNQEQLEKAISLSKKQIQDARNIQELGVADKQLKELMKLRDKDGVDQKLLEKAISEKKEEVLINYHAKVIQLQQKENKLKYELTVQAAKDGFEAIGKLLELGAEKYKAAAIALKIVRTAEATANTYVAANNALASVPFPWNVAAAASIVIEGLANVAKINDVKFATGAISVPGIGNTDSVSAKLTPGEMVVPKTFAEGIRSGELSLGKSQSSSEKGANIFINVSLEGANLYGVPSMELIKDIFTQAAEYIRAGLMPALT